MLQSTKVEHVQNKSMHFVTYVEFGQFVPSQWNPTSRFRSCLVLLLNQTQRQLAGCLPPNYVCVCVMYVCVRAQTGCGLGFSYPLWSACCACMWNGLTGWPLTQCLTESLHCTSDELLVCLLLCIRWLLMNGTTARQTLLPITLPPVDWSVRVQCSASLCKQRGWTNKDGWFGFKFRMFLKFTSSSFW